MIENSAGVRDEIIINKNLVNNTTTTTVYLSGQRKDVGYGTVIECLKAIGVDNIHYNKDGSLVAVAKSNQIK